MPTPLRRLWSDPVLASVVAFGSLLLGFAYLMQTEQIQYKTHGLYREWYAPSVMLAAGEGFVHPLNYAEGGPFDQFLRREREALSWEDVPRDFNPGTPGGIVALHRYLFYAIGLTWRLLGLSWGAVDVLLAMLYAAAVTLVYGVLRLGMNRGFSLMGAILFAVSPIVLHQVAIFRELSKAPFLVGAIGLIIYLVKEPRTARQRVGAACALGVLLGLGIGFRYDVIVALPAAALALTFAPATETKVWHSRALTLFLLAAGFLLLGTPILSAESSRGTHDHIIGGFSEGCDARMGVCPASYARVQMNEDMLTYAIVNHYARYGLGMDKHIGFISPEGEEPGTAYLLHTIWMFPGDMVARGLASVIQILRNPPVTYPMPPIPLLESLQRMGAAIGSHLMDAGPGYVAALLIVICWRDPRRGWLSLVLVLYFGAYPSLQFFPRHYYHLTFFSMFAFGVLLEGLAAALWRARDWLSREALTTGVRARWPAARRTAVHGTAAAAMVIAGLWACRGWQYFTVGSLLDRWNGAALAPVSLERAPEDEAGRVGEGVFLRTTKAGEAAPPVAGEGGHRIHSRYMVAVLRAEARPMQVGIQYIQRDWAGGFSRIERVETPGAPGDRVRFFFPVYEFPAPLALGRGANRFAGLILPGHQLDRFEGLYEVAAVGEFPLLVQGILPDDVSQVKRWQTLGCYSGEPLQGG